MTTPESPPAIDVYESGPGWVVGHVRDVVVMIWLQHPVLEGVEALGRSLSRNIRRFQASNLVTVVVGDVGTQPLSNDIRVRTVEVLKRYQKSIRRSAIVIEATGVRGSLARSTLTAIDLLIRPEYQNRVFSSCARASVWVSETSNHNVEWSTIADACYVLREPQSKLTTGIRSIRVEGAPEKIHSVAN